jgi:hypothetical protein
MVQFQFRDCTKLTSSEDWLWAGRGLGTPAGNEPLQNLHAAFDVCHVHDGYCDGMDTEQTIAEIERLERIFSTPDTRPLTPSDLAAANRRHDDMLAHSPWFRLWRQYGVCCRSEFEGRLRIQS